MGLPVPATGKRFIGKLFINVESFFPEGWVETYHLRSANYAPAKADLDALWQARRQMLAGDCSLAYATVSDEGMKGDSLIMHPATAGTIAGDYGDSSIHTLPAWNVCLARVESGPLYRSFRPVRGLPSDVILTSPPAFSASWHTAAVNFFDLVAAKCYNRVKVKPNDPDKLANDPDHIDGYRLILNTELVRFSEHRSGRPFGLLRGRSRRRVTL